jgi:hypothetical protein
MAERMYPLSADGTPMRSSFSIYHVETLALWKEPGPLLLVCGVMIGNVVMSKEIVLYPNNLRTHISKTERQQHEIDLAFLIDLAAVFLV